MNDPMIIAGAIVLVIAATGSWIVQIINAKAAADDRREAKAMRLELQKTSDATLKKTDVVIEKTVEIHALTNANLSKVTASLDTALAKITGLEKLVIMLTEAKAVADNLAVAATQQRNIRVTDNPKTLQEIENNTSNTVDAIKELNNKKEKK